jgi:hypothetical protein
MKNQESKSKLESAEQPNGEGLSSSVLFGDSVQALQRRYRLDYANAKKLQDDLASIFDGKAVMAYRQRDPSDDGLCDHWTVVNEDEKPRRGHTGPTFAAAFIDAFPPNA